MLTGNETPAVENELINEDIDILASQGAQPSLLTFKEKQQILVWGTSPNQFQTKRLAQALVNSYYKHFSTEEKIENNSSIPSSPLSKSLKKRKIERIYNFYNKPENPPEVIERVQKWKQSQPSLFKCALL